MLHIIAKPFVLISFLLESLPPEWHENIHWHPNNLRGPKYSLLKTLDSMSSFKTPGLYSLPEDFLKSLTAIPPEAAVLIFSIENVKELKVIKKYLRTSRIALFSWNPVTDHDQESEIRREHILRLKSLGFRIFTFDPADAGRHQLSLVSQVYRRVDGYRKALPAEFDVYFLGKDKGRFKMLDGIGQMLAGQRLRAHFLMVAKRDISYPSSATVEIINQEITYQQNIDFINRSRCLLELTQNNQAGLTIRCLEALFFGKKLITDNPLVRQLPFFHPDRFFILGLDDPARIGDFVRGRVPAVADTDLRGYEFPNWIRQFEIALSDRPIQDDPVTPEPSDFL